MIEVGMTYTAEKTVTPDMTAKAIGSGGLEVFGTPFMMGLVTRQNAEKLLGIHQ